MTPLEAIQKIQQMFTDNGMMPVAEAPAAQMAEESAQPIESVKEYVLMSGQKVLIDKLELGGKVMIVDEAGNQSPAPVGEHELADGTKIVLDEAGTILEISLPESDKVEEEIMPDAPVEPSAQDMMKKKIEEMQKQLDEIKISYDAKLAQQEARFSKGISDLSDVLVQLINTPSAEATEQPKDKFNVHVESKEAKLERFLQFAKSIK
jgi:hypothetical protein